MLDMGFEPQIRTILGQMRVRVCCLFLFSSVFFSLHCCQCVFGHLFIPCLNGNDLLAVFLVLCSLVYSISLTLVTTRPFTGSVRLYHISQ